MARFLTAQDKYRSEYVAPSGKIAFWRRIPLYFLSFTGVVKNMTTTVSSKGQVTVPRELRDKLGLTPGTKLQFELGDDGTLLCRKAASHSFFSRFQGIGTNKGLPYPSGDEAVAALRGRVEKGDVD